MTEITSEKTPASALGTTRERKVLQEYEKEMRQSNRIKNGMPIFSGTLIDLFLNSVDTWGELDKKTKTLVLE